MPNTDELCEVTVSSGNVRVHKADSFYVDERGHLLISLEKKSVAIYAPGAWTRLNVAGNVQAKS